MDNKSSISEENSESINILNDEKKTVTEISSITTVKDANQQDVFEDSKNQKLHQHKKQKLESLSYNKDCIGNQNQNEDHDHHKQEFEHENEIREKQTCYNPSITDDLKDEDLEKMKGDAIGNTLYSERFVLSTLIKLTKLNVNLNDDEEFEKDLCSLWDMSIEKDVVELLLEHKVLELFSNIIKQTEDRRLTEILIGIIGNMCNLNETRVELCMNNDVIMPILDLISCTDTLTLIQLMRLLHTTLVFENSGDELIWFQHFKNCDNFVENLSYILSNSINKTLLINSLEALNAICAKFAIIDIQPSSSINNENNENNDNTAHTFSDLFVQPSLLAGVNEAFATLLPQKQKTKSILQSPASSSTTTFHQNKRATGSTNNLTLNDSINDKDLDSINTNYDDTTTIQCCDLLTQNSQKIISLFLDIHVLLSQYGQKSKKCYNQILDDLMKCISQILTPLCQSISLLPLTFNEQGIVENVNELFQALDDPFDEICFAQMITIWNIIDTNRDLKEKSGTSSAAAAAATTTTTTTTTASAAAFKWDDDDENDLISSNSKNYNNSNDNVNDNNYSNINNSDNGNFNNTTADFDEEVNSEDICMTILEYLTRTIRNSTEEKLKYSLRLTSPLTIMKLLSALSAGDSEPDIQDCCIKIKKIFDMLDDDDNKLSNSTNMKTSTTNNDTSHTSTSNNSNTNIAIKTNKNDKIGRFSK